MRAKSFVLKGVRPTYYIDDTNGRFSPVLSHFEGEGDGESKKTINIQSHLETRKKRNERRKMSSKQLINQSQNMVIEKAMNIQKLNDIDVKDTAL
mgnify:CR=1 FL=1